MLKKIQELDKKIYLYFNKIPNTILNKYLATLTNLATGGSYGLLLGFLLFFIDGYRSYSYILVMAVILNGIDVNLILKNIFRRERPFDKLKIEKLSIKKPKDYSFPSGHTAVTTTITVVLCYMGIVENFNFIFLVANILFMIIMGYSRIRLKVHYLSDVIAGFLIGLINGFFMILIKPSVDKLMKDVFSFLEI